MIPHFSRIQIATDIAKTYVYFWHLLYLPIGKSNVSKNPIINNSEIYRQSKLSKEMQKYGVIFPNCCHSSNEKEILMQKKKKKIIGETGNKILGYPLEIT